MCMTRELRADLIVRNGAILRIVGYASTDSVTELRLRSLSDGVYTHVTQLAADFGTLDLDSVHVRSWDDAAMAPDGDATVPPCPSGTKLSQCPRGRAFIRALSSLDADGSTRHESSMNEHHQQRGRPSRLLPSDRVRRLLQDGERMRSFHLGLCGHVFGTEVDSSFHDNYMGTSWGAQGIMFLRNQYSHNVMYGLDPHDVSNDLVSRTTTCPTTADVRRFVCLC